MLADLKELQIECNILNEFTSSRMSFFFFSFRACAKHMSGAVPLTHTHKGSAEFSPQRPKENMQWFMNWEISTNTFHSQEIKCCAIRVKLFAMLPSFRSVQKKQGAMIFAWMWSGILMRWNCFQMNLVDDACTKAHSICILEKAGDLARCHRQRSNRLLFVCLYS